MSTKATDLLEEVLRAARGNGLDQTRLARAAGVAAETISRAKRRGNIELRTLTALASAAGVRLRVEDAKAPFGQHGRAKPRSSLADPRWGIAWSNPDVDVPALVTNALLKGSYDVILEAAAEHGLPLVQARWRALKEERPARLSVKATAAVERMLKNIAKGFARAAA